MMYEYLYAVGRYKNYRPGSHVIDIRQYRLSDLVKYFAVLDIVVTDTFYKRKVRLSMEDLLGSFAGYNKSIVDFLTENGNNVLPLHVDYPKEDPVFAKWISLAHKGLMTYPGNVNLANDSQSKLTADAAPDILLKHETNDNVDYKALADNALFIVNGTFSRAVGRKSGLYLIGAGNDFKALKHDVLVSAITFERIGKIKTIPITREMLRKVTEGGNDKILIDLDKNEELNDKTIWMVFNGQLCVDDEIIAHIGSNTLRFGHQYIDMLRHHLNYKQYTRCPEWTDQSKRAEYVESALYWDNSFIVIIDNPTVGVNVVPLQMFKWPSGGTTQETFEHPIMLENSLFPYVNRRTYGINERLVNFDIHHQYDPVINTVGSLAGNQLFDSINRGSPGTLPAAFEFQIAGIQYD